MKSQTHDPGIQTGEKVKKNLSAVGRRADHLQVAALIRAESIPSGRWYGRDQTVCT